MLFSSTVRSNVFWFLRVFLAHCSTLFVIASTMLGLLCCIRVINDRNGVQQFVFRLAMYFSTQIALRLLPFVQGLDNVFSSSEPALLSRIRRRVESNEKVGCLLCKSNAIRGCDEAVPSVYNAARRDEEFKRFFFVFASSFDTVRVQYKSSF